MAKEDVEATVFVVTRANGDGLSEQCFGKPQLEFFELNPAAFVDFADNVPGGIFNRRQHGWQTECAGPVALCRRLHTEGFGANQPNTKPRQRALRCAAPGRAVVCLNPSRQAIALKTLQQT